MVTFGGETDDAFDLLPSVATTLKSAQVRGCQMVLRSTMGVAAAQRSVASKGAFIQATKGLVQNMLKSLSKKLEIQLMYGQAGLATVASVATTQVTINAAQWAPGIWAGSERMRIEIRNAAGSTLRGDFAIASVNFDTKTLTLSADAAAAGVVATDVIYFEEAYGKEMAGLHRILSNTGVLFNIDAAQYSLWKASTYDAGAAALSFAKIQEAIAKGVEKGLDSDACVIVNPEVWADLLTEQAALRVYDSSYKREEAENGMRSIKFHSQNGIVEIVPSIYCKRGFAYVLAKDELVRIGSTDITFKRPGKEGEFFLDLPEKNGYEIRAYSDQALFTYSVAKHVLITNIG